MPYPAQTQDSGDTGIVAAVGEQAMGRRGTERSGQGIWGHQGLSCPYSKAHSSCQETLSVSRLLHLLPQTPQSPYQHQRICANPWGSPHPTCVFINNHFTKHLFTSHNMNMPLLPTGTLTDRHVISYNIKDPVAKNG